MARTPFGTPFRRRPERFPDQTRPDQSVLTSCSWLVDGWDSFIRRLSEGDE